jgi:hypothetical protein
MFKPRIGWKLTFAELYLRKADRQTSKNVLSKYMKHRVIDAQQLSGSILHQWNRNSDFNGCRNGDRLWIVGKGAATNRPLHLERGLKASSELVFRTSAIHPF